MLAVFGHQSLWIVMSENGWTPGAVPHIVTEMDRETRRLYTALTARDPPRRGVDHGCSDGCCAADQ